MGMNVVAGLVETLYFTNYFETLEVRVVGEFNSKEIQVIINDDLVGTVQANDIVFLRRDTKPVISLFTSIGVPFKFY